MIARLSHATIFVKDQDAARAFYVDKLGFSVTNDVRMGPVRWLTVRPPEQKELDIVLLDPAVIFDDEPEIVDCYRTLLDAGKLGAGVFNTADCAKTYEELKAKGVTFRQPPHERPYGIEAVFEDDSGNWFSLTQVK